MKIYLEFNIVSKRKGFFIVEASLSSDTNNGLYAMKQPQSITNTQKLFVQFMKEGCIEFDANWEKSKELSQPSNTKRNSTVILSIISIVILVATSFAAIGSNKPWYEGFIAGLLAIAYIFTLMKVQTPYYQKAYKKVIKHSIEIGMPVEIYGARGIRPIDKKNKDRKKLAKLEMMLLGKIIVGVIIAFAILGCMVLIAYLLQKYQLLFQ